MDATAKCWPRLHRKRGTTLIEMLVVLAIIAIFGAILLINYRKPIAKAWKVRHQVENKDYGIAKDGQPPREHENE